jgi:hypothetical protein
MEKKFNFSFLKNYCSILASRNPRLFFFSDSINIEFTGNKLSLIIFFDSFSLGYQIVLDVFTLLSKQFKRFETKKLKELSLV